MASTVDRLKAIHRRVFDDFEYIHDIEKWKVPDYWLSKQDILAMSILGKWKGDCDDMALIVRHFARLDDIPNRLVFCWVPEANGYHLGLEHEGWFSDCRYPHLMRRDDVPYEWISLSGFQAGDKWHYVDGFDHTQPWPHERGFA